MAERIEITEETPIKLHRQVRLRFDKARSLWLLLAPEKVVTLDEIAVHILQEIDGAPLFEAIDRLALKFNAPREVIAVDVIGFLQDFADRGYLMKEGAFHG